MKDAYVESLQLLATPFHENTQQPFALGLGSTWAGITSEIRELIPIIISRRQTGNVLHQKVRICRTCFLD
jgi:hypothetical protein